MQNKPKFNNKKGKFKPFQKKKPRQTDLEAQEIQELQSKYDSVDLKEVKTFADLPISKRTLKGKFTFFNKAHQFLKSVSNFFFRP